MTQQDLINELNSTLSGNKMSVEELYRWEIYVGKELLYRFYSVPYFTTDDTGKIAL